MAPVAAPFGGGVAADAGDDFRDAGIVGRHRAGGGAVQVADGGAAQIDGVGCHAAAAFRRQERSDVGAAGGQGREVAPGTPAAPGAHC